jgi:hypothetical protein
LENVFPKPENMCKGSKCGNKQVVRKPCPTRIAFQPSNNPFANAVIEGERKRRKKAILLLTDTAGSGELLTGRLGWPITAQKSRICT